MLMEGFHRKQLGNCIWRCFDLWDTGVIKLIPIYNSCELKICSIKYEFSRGFIIHGGCIMKYYTIAGKHDRNHLVSIVLSAFQMRLMKYTSSIGCKVCDEGFVFEKDRIIRDTGFPEAKDSL